MSNFKVQSVFTTEYFSVEGFVLLTNTTEEQIKTSLQEFVDSVGDEDEFYFSDCEPLEEVPDMDGYTVVELSDVEYKMLTTMFDDGFGIFVGPEFD